MSKIAVTGNAGPRIRSDCELKLELRSGGGIELKLDSKVKSMFGNSISADLEKGLAFFGVKNALLEVNDSGALPFVLMARLEAAVKALVDSDKELLPDMIQDNKYGTDRKRFRFSRLYLPGNTPSMMLNAGLHSPDGIILDLEDSVAPAKKDEARFLVRNALRQINFYGAERMVRINQGERGIEDLKYILPHNVNLILVPKCENAEYVKKLELESAKILEGSGEEHEVFFMPIIETALGVEKAYEIASASKTVVALAIGLEDYTADLGVQRTNEGTESLYARLRLVNAARAAGVQAIDSVFSDVSDMQALKRTAEISKSYGFEGMGCIHPRQIQVIKDAFAPGVDEIEKAAKIVKAYREAEEKGQGVVAIGSKMIDPPVVARALRTIDLAEKLELLPEESSDDDN
ncbi:MAG: aldolase/citrate lyase family protein [Bacteroidales bacterium]|nr:aldolase/citrate lyase family protein [Bacteroidales bacterium]